MRRRPDCKIAVCQLVVFLAALDLSATLFETTSPGLRGEHRRDVFRPQALQGTENRWERQDNNFRAERRFALRLRGGGFEEYDKWDKIVDSDESREKRETRRDVTSHFSDLIEPTEEDLKCVQGNFTSFIQGIVEKPHVVGRKVTWTNTPKREASGLYKAMHFNASLYVNGWIMRKNESNYTHIVWYMKDPEYDMDDILVWRRDNTTSE